MPCLPQDLPHGANELKNLNTLPKVGQSSTTEAPAAWSPCPPFHHIPNHSRLLTPDLLLDFLGGVQPVLQEKQSFLEER